MVQTSIVQYQRLKPSQKSSHQAGVIFSQADARGSPACPPSLPAAERGADAEGGGRACFVCEDAVAHSMVLIECWHGGLCSGEAPDYPEIESGVSPSHLSSMQANKIVL